MKNIIIYTIIAVVSIALAGFCVHQFDVSHQLSPVTPSNVVVQQVMPSTSTLAELGYVPAPLSDILTVQGSTTAQTCFFLQNGTCQMTLADFLSLESMLPALKALSSGKVLVSSDAVLVPTSATGTTPLTAVLQNIYQSLQTPTQQ